MGFKIELLMTQIQAGLLLCLTHPSSSCHLHSCCNMSDIFIHNTMIIMHKIMGTQTENITLCGRKRIPQENSLTNV